MIHDGFVPLTRPADVEKFAPQLPTDTCDDFLASDYIGLHRTGTQSAVGNEDYIISSCSSQMLIRRDQVTNRLPPYYMRYRGCKIQLTQPDLPVEPPH